MIQRLSAGQASDAANAELLVQVLAFLRRILSVRNLCVYSAHLGIAGGKRSLPLEQHIAAQPLLTTHQLYMKPGDAAGSSELMHAATAALRASGAAGASLARVLEEPYAANQYYMAARRSATYGFVSSTYGYSLYYIWLQPLPYYMCRAQEHAAARRRLRRPQRPRRPRRPAPREPIQPAGVAALGGGGFPARPALSHVRRCPRALVRV